ncbi:MAG: hypothetical protein IJ341_07360 [Bacteroidales bacterium]|nr:hypothetical protein [Bacteroidales bacterium]MBQ7819498.1 hypothetical protein [Bacteroidales bacterium]
MNYIKILEEQEKLLFNEIKEHKIKMMNKIKNICPQNIKDPIGKFSEKVSYIFLFTEGIRYGSALFNTIKNIISKN